MYFLKKIAIAHFCCGILTPKSCHLLVRVVGKHRLFLMLSTTPAVVISPRCQSVALHAQPSTLRRAACSRCLSCVRGAVCLFPRWSCSTSPVNSTSEVSGVAREQRVQDWTSNAAVARMGWKKESPTSAPWGKLEKAVSQCCSNRGRY